MSVVAEIGEAYGTLRGHLLYVAIDVDKLMTYAGEGWCVRKICPNEKWIHLPGIRTEDLSTKWRVSVEEIDKAVAARFHKGLNGRGRTRTGGGSHRSLAFAVEELHRVHGTGRIFASHFRAIFYSHISDPHHEDNSMRAWERFKARLVPRGVPHIRGEDYDGGALGTSGSLKQVYIKLKPQALEWADQELKGKMDVKNYKAEIFEFRVGGDDAWQSETRPMVTLAVRDFRGTYKTFLNIRMGTVRRPEEMRALASAIEGAADFLDRKIAERVGLA